MFNSKNKNSCDGKRLFWLCFSLAVSAHFFEPKILSTKGNKPHASPTMTSPSWNFPADLQKNSQLSCGGGLWQGTFETLNSEPQFSSPPVSIAIAFCEHSLSWLDQLIQGLDIRNITIYSKCGNEVSNISTRTRVVKLRNVGRVDHAYAYHLANLPEETDPDEVQLFLKDTYPAFHQLQLRNM